MIENEVELNAARDRSGKFKKGMVPWNRGKPMSTESKLKESKSKLGKPARYINYTKEERIKSILVNRGMSKPEQLLYEIIKDNNLPFEFSGNGGFWIKEGDKIFNPDFINKKDKLIIELFSRWHYTIGSNIRRDEQRKEIYIKQGYRFLIINEEELKDKIKVLNSIRELLK